MKIAPFNRLEILSSDLNFLQDNKDQAIAQRIVDNFLIPGIVTPLGVVPSDMQDGLTNVANVPFQIAADAGDTATPTIKVGPDTLGADVHIAYDQLGNRIHLPLADDHYATPVWNGNAPALTTVGVTGNTPYSTGRRQVHVPKPGSGSTDYYIFASYVPVVRTISVVDNPAYPPNHQTVNGATTITPSNDGNKPIEGIDELQGLAYAHHIIDGYRIFAGVTAGGQVTNTGPGQTPRLASNVFTGLTIAGPNEPDSANAIFIGKVNVTSGGTITITQDNTRPILRFKSEDSATLSTLTATYTINQVVTLLEHINARGTRGLGPTPNNPHDIGAVDVGAIFNTVSGLASKQSFVPINENPNFQFYPTITNPTPTIPTTWFTPASGGGGSVAATAASGTDLTNDIQILGPQVSTGIHLAFTPDVTNGLNVKFTTLAYPLKPSRSYTAIGWIKTSTAGIAANLSMHLENTAGGNISGGAETPSGLSLSGAWQRFSVLLTTTPTATVPEIGSKLALVFSNAATSTYANVLMSNVVLVEGDWTLGDVATKQQQSYRTNLSVPGFGGGSGDQPYQSFSFVSNGQFAVVSFSSVVQANENQSQIQPTVSRLDLYMTPPGGSSTFLSSTQGGQSYIQGFNAGGNSPNFSQSFRVTWMGYLAPGTHIVTPHMVGWSAYGGTGWPGNTGILEVQLL